MRNYFFPFAVVFTTLLTGCFHALHPKPSKKIRQADISYAVTVRNAGYGNHVSIETKILVKNESKFVELTAPSCFKVDNTELLLSWDPKNPDSKDYYVNPIQLSELNCGTHAFTFIDADKKNYTDSFWYCEPTLDKQTLKWLNDSTISLQVDGDAKTDSLYFYLANEASIQSTANKAVPIKNGVAIIVLSSLAENFKTLLQKDYFLFAFCNYTKKLQRGTITVKTNSEAGISLKRK
ncbi:MAG: hypothetical protein WDM90_02790 [Ferruginibacter sp.]